MNHEDIVAETESDDLACPSTQEGDDEGKSDIGAFPWIGVEEKARLQLETKLPWMKHLIKEEMVRNQAAGFTPSLYDASSAWGSIGSRLFLLETQAAGFTPSSYDVIPAWGDIEFRLIECFHQWHYFRNQGLGAGHSKTQLTQAWVEWSKDPTTHIRQLTLKLICAMSWRRKKSTSVGK